MISEVRVISKSGGIHRAFQDGEGNLFTIEDDNADDMLGRQVLNLDDPLPSHGDYCNRCFPNADTRPEAPAVD